jgi:hypothetical protein
MIEQRVTIRTPNLSDNMLTIGKLTKVTMIDISEPSWIAPCDQPKVSDSSGASVQTE